MSDKLSVTDPRQLAEKALRTPDLEWARDLVHDLARELLSALDQLDRAMTAAEQALAHADTLVVSTRLARDRAVAAEARAAAYKQALRGMEEPCPDCGGSGYLTDEECSWCGATGRIMKSAPELAAIVDEALAAGEEPDHFEGNIGANIAGGYDPAAAEETK